MSGIENSLDQIASSLREIEKSAHLGAEVDLSGIEESLSGIETELESQIGDRLESIDKHLVETNYSLMQLIKVLEGRL